MHVISKVDTDYLKKGEKYNITRISRLEYQIEIAPKHYSWIGKDDTVHFEYHIDKLETDWN